MKNEHCWGCPHSTMNFNKMGEVFFMCDLSNMRISCKAPSPRLLKLEQAPQWCPINEKEKAKNIIPIVY